MADDDRTHWDDRYSAAAEATARVSIQPQVPSHFAEFADVFTAANTAVEIACGAGGFAVWLATHGVDVTGYDISPVAVAQATAAAVRADVAQRCNFLCVDLDDGLPPGEPVDLVVCNRFRDARLDGALMARLAAGGVLAIAALSEVGASPGRFRVAPGELQAAFAELTTLGSFEADGLAWIVARKAG